MTRDPVTQGYVSDPQLFGKDRLNTMKERAHLSPNTFPTAILQGKSTATYPRCLVHHNVCALASSVPEKVCYE